MSLSCFVSTVIPETQKVTSMNAAALWAKLLQLRDEMRLKTHLLELDSIDAWHALDKRIQAIEVKMISKARQLGVAEEYYFVGSDADIKTLIEQVEALQQDEFEHQHD